MSNAILFYKPRALQFLLKSEVLAGTRIFTSTAVANNPQPSRKRTGRVAKVCLGLLTSALATCGVVIYVLERSVVEAAHVSVHPPRLPWSFRGALASLDHSAIRRGWTVYKNVCSACHSIQFVAFRDLVNVCLTEEEARDLAAEYEIEDGPDEKGEYYMRPGKLHDRVPPPFPNEEAARAANNGSYPVDLSYVILARNYGPDYLFGLLTGYVEETPAGVELRDGQAFNAYFEGGAISMPEMLHDGVVEYDDGTPAHKSQMAKDVVEFLTWTSDQHWDTRKLVFFKGIGICIILFASIYPIFRRKMSLHRNTIVCYIPKSKRCD